MVVQARHKAVNLNMFIIPHLDLKSDLEALEAHFSLFLLAAPSEGSCELPVCQRTSAVLYLIEMQITLACHWLAGC